MRWRRVVLLIVATSVLGTGAWAQETVAFETIAPSFEARCAMCHAGPAATLGLDVTTEEGLLAGSVRGPVVIPGDPEASALILRLRGDAVPRMPLTGPPYFTDEEVARVALWIEGLVATPNPVADVGEVAGRGAAVDVDTTEPPGVPIGPPSGSFVGYADVAPVFARHCVRCHVQGGRMGAPPEGFILASYKDLLDSGDEVRVVPGRPEASELLRRIRGDALPRMPYDGPPWLSEEEVALVSRWIADGARDEAGVEADVPIGGSVRLHGTWQADRSLDGLRLRLAGARIDDDVVPGVRVEVRGTIGEDGIHVDRVKED